MPVAPVPLTAVAESTDHASPNESHTVPRCDCEAGSLRRWMCAVVAGFSLPECVPGDAGTRTTIALMGDQHTAMWHPTLETDCHGSALAVGDDEQGVLCPADESADQQP